VTLLVNWPRSSTAPRSTNTQKTPAPPSGVETVAVETRDSRVASCVDPQVAVTVNLAAPWSGGVMSAEKSPSEFAVVSAIVVPPIAMTT
jgi:hypothetical protein